MTVFSPLWPNDSLKLNKPPKISFVQRINWLTTWPHLTTGKINEAFETLVQIHVLPKGFFFFLPLNRTTSYFIPLAVCLSAYVMVLFTVIHFLFVVSTFCFLALQETEMEKLQKMKRVRMFLEREKKNSVVFWFFWYYCCLENMFIRSCERQQHCQLVS